MSFHEDRLRTLAPETLRGMHRGIEKESLRVRSDGALSQAPHPPALGSPLTHPHITTDFSEAQFELITGVHGSVEACLQELTWIHQFVYRHIGDEILWCASMPCNLPADNQIPIGRYGTSNVGRAKTVYRLGLALRYGRRMQAKAGIRDNDNYRQLSTSLLQIENEFYGSIRPKRRINSGERALHALRERGVEYVEVRLMDLDPFCPIGIWPATCRFLDLFLLHCLLADSPPDTTQEIAAIRRNQQRVALRGREPGLKLQKDSDELELVRWGGQILSECAPIAEALDQANGGGSAHRDALAAALQALRTSDSVPSAKVLQAMAREHRNSFVRFALAESTLHKASLKGHELPREANERFTGLADWSLERQREIEAADKVPFEAWRQKYLSHDTLVV